MRADGFLQLLVPLVDQAVVVRLDQQLRALTSLHLPPGEGEIWVFLFFILKRLH